MSKYEEKNNQFKLNYQIKSLYVKLVDENNQMVGQFKTNDAIQLAKSKDLDLILVNSNSNPPIAKMGDYNKMLYEQKKRAKTAKKNVQKLHTIQLHLGTEENDLNHKFKQIRTFLSSGDLVKFTLMLSGRELQFKKQAFEFMDSCLQKLSDVATYDSNPKMAGKNIEVLLRKISEKQIKH